MRVVHRPWRHKHPPQTFSWYVSNITGHWGEATSAIIYCGAMLSEAQGILPHGQWTKMVKKHLPFSSRTAQKLMRIAEDARIMATRESLLPKCVATLYELRRLSDSDWKKGIRRGVIRSEMKFRDAWNLTHKAKAQERATKAAEQNIGTDVSLWLADPPWRPKFALPYKVLSLDRIKGLRLRPDGRASSDPKYPSVAEASAPCAALGLWAIDELLHEAEEVMAAWGFKLLTPRIIWDKQTHGHTGGAALHTHEYLLIGVKGGAMPTKRFKSVVTIPRGELANSEKPVRFHSMLAEMFPLLIERRELFARRPTPAGWRGWGDGYPGDCAQTRAA